MVITCVMLCYTTLSVVLGNYNNTMTTRESIIKQLTAFSKEDFEHIGWDTFFKGDHCCPGDDYAAMYREGIKACIELVHSIKP